MGFAQGALEGAELVEAERHLAGCEECRQLVSELARDARPSDGAHAATLPSQPTTMGDRGELPVREGDLLAGKYRVERVLGAGGMGIVVAATHVHLGQKVALKFLLPAACGTAGTVVRFLREARAAVQIKGEHVARVIDVGTLERGEPYIVMEFLSGMDFAEVLKTRGPLPIAEALDFVLQAGEAIAEAHALGIVHRDLKPANLFLTARPDGSPLVKVLDFGISKGGDGASSALTSKELIMGSPRYMSPEQMRSSRDVDARTDIWALGVVLFEMLTGKAVFESDSMAGLCTLVATAPAPPLRSARADAPAALEVVVSRCLEKDPARRVQSVAELAEALSPMAPARAKVSVERIRRLHAGSSLIPPPMAPVAKSSRFPPGLSLPVLLGAVLVVIAAVSVGMLVRAPSPAVANVPEPLPSFVSEPPAPTPPRAAVSASSEPSPAASAIALPTASAPKAAKVKPRSSAPAASPSAPDENRGLLDRN
ncbi:MAG: protein kinase [Polyangiaceae bacterium]